MARRGATSYVEIDGVFYAIGACRDGRVLTTCLRHVGALPEDPSLSPQRFATPP